MTRNPYCYRILRKNGREKADLPDSPFINTHTEDRKEAQKKARDAARACARASGNPRNLKAHPEYRTYELRRPR